LTIAPASSSSVHRARPSGGLEQAVALRIEIEASSSQNEFGAKF